MNEILNTKINYIENEMITKEEHPINIFINEFNNIKTKNEYKRTIIKFFNYFYKINNILEITAQMLLEINSPMVREYRDYLYKHYCSSSVSKYIKNIKRLYNFLINEYVDNVTGKKIFINNPCNNIKLSTKHDTRSYGSFTEKEIKQLIEIGDNQCSVFYEMAVTLSLRKNSLLNLHLQDFYQDNEVWILNTIDKSNEFNNSIPNSLYQKCIELANFHNKIYNNNNNKIFNMDNSTINYKLNNDLLKIGLTQKEIDKRYLRVHSFRTTSAILGLKINNYNLEKTKKHTNHKSIKVLEGYTNQENKDYQHATSIKINNQLHSNQNVKTNLLYEIKDILQNNPDALGNILLNMDDNFQIELLKQINNYKTQNNIK